MYVVPLNLNINNSVTVRVGKCKRKIILLALVTNAPDVYYVPNHSYENTDMSHIILGPIQVLQPTNISVPYLSPFTLSQIGSKIIHPNLTLFVWPYNLCVLIIIGQHFTERQMESLGIISCKKSQLIKTHSTTRFCKAIFCKIHVPK